MYIVQSEGHVSTKALKEVHKELVRQAKEGVWSFLVILNLSELWKTNLSRR